MKKLFIVWVIIFLSASIYGEEIKRRENFPPEIVLEPKSKKKAIALSLLVPGLGEHYMGSKKDALRAYVIEGGIWCTFFGLRWYAGALTNDYILYAHANSGAHKGQSNGYYDAVEWYEDLEAYNTAVREEARYLYPEEKYGDKARELQLKYIEEHGYPNSVAWDWSDAGEWDKYRAMRKHKRNILQNASYCVGVAILNRIVSAVIATHLPPSGFGLHIEPNGFKIVKSLK